MKRKKIYILIYNEFEDSEYHTREAVIASSSKKTIKAYKKDLEEKSSVIRNTLNKMEIEKDNQLSVLRKAMNSLDIAISAELDTCEYHRLSDERKKLINVTRTLFMKYHNKKSNLWRDTTIGFSNDGFETAMCQYIIEDPETSGFSINVLEII
jgi:hypothetical protein